MDSPLRTIKSRLYEGVFPQVPSQIATTRRVLAVGAFQKIVYVFLVKLSAKTFTADER